MHHHHHHHRHHHHHNHHHHQSLLQVHGDVSVASRSTSSTIPRWTRWRCDRWQVATQVTTLSPRWGPDWSWTHKSAASKFWALPASCASCAAANYWQIGPKTGGWGESDHFWGCNVDLGNHSKKSEKFGHFGIGNPGEPQKKSCPWASRECSSKRFINIVLPVPTGPAAWDAGAVGVDMTQWCYKLQKLG